VHEKVVDEMFGLPDRDECHWAIVLVHHPDHLAFRLTIEIVERITIAISPFEGAPSGLKINFPQRTTISFDERSNLHPEG
jgi:hypothetical protein